MQLLNERLTNWLPKDRPLKRDVRQLGELLGRVLIEQEGHALFALVERIRRLAKRARAAGGGDSTAMRQLTRPLDSLDVDTAARVTRAFHVYFQLVNLAEQNHRIRRKRQYEHAHTQPQRGSIQAIVERLKERNVEPEFIQRLLDKLSIELVMTAHPTETVRRTVLDKHTVVARLLEALDQPLLTPKERDRLRQRLHEEVVLLWQTDELRASWPSALDEARHGLFYVDAVLFDVLPAVHRELERCLRLSFPDTTFRVPSFLRFGTWMGGDRDGNPNVTWEVSWKAPRAQKTLVLAKYIERVEILANRYSQSTERIPVLQECRPMRLPGTLPVPLRLSSSVPPHASSSAPSGTLRRRSVQLPDAAKTPAEMRSYWTRIPSCSVPYYCGTLMSIL